MLNHGITSYCRVNTRLAWALLSLCLSAASYANDNLWHSLSHGKVDLSLRYRFEYADDAQPSLQSAYASTLRTAVGYRTEDWLDTSLYFQIQDVRVVGNDQLFNDGSNNVLDHSIITDPESTEIQQYYLRYGGLPKTVLTIGRQEFNHRQGVAQRFLGNVAFRQHHQSFDAARMVSLAIPHTVIDYSYIWNVNRIFGENNPLSDADDFRSNSHALNVQYNGLSWIKLESYLYLLEFTSSTARRFSSATAGLRAQGDVTLGNGFAVNYAGEFSHQQDYSNNPNNISANYALAELGINYAVNEAWLNKIGLKYDYERLEGNGGVNAFQTPLGTNHAFQGFADRFLVTPGDGIQDHFITLSGVSYGIQFSAVYHRFVSDKENYNYGDEWDILVEHDFDNGLLVGLKWADYRANNNILNQNRNLLSGQVHDLTRFWAYFQYTY